MMLPFIIISFTAYIVGSVNLSILLFRIMGKDDPRNHFSKNAGVTNVYRQTGILTAALVLILDIAKSMAVAIISIRVLPIDIVPWCGFFLILGNSYPCFHNFRGGKGVANYLGFISVITPIFAAVSMLTWGIICLLFKLPFIASFILVFILSAGAVITGSNNPVYVAGIIIIIAFIIFRHRSNVREFLQDKPG